VRRSVCGVASDLHRRDMHLTMADYPAFPHD